MPQFTVQTDESHVVTLPSAIESVRWSRSRAAPGATVGLQIRTVFCGEGSQVKVQLVDAQGTRHSTLSGQLHNNYVDVSLRVPESAKGGLVAKVKMPKHSLSEESAALQVTNPTRPASARWSSETARRGDILTLTTDVRGAKDGESAVVQIFQHDESGAHDPVGRLQTRVERSAVKVEYQFQFSESTSRIIPEWNAPDGYEHPTYFFTTSVLGVETTSLEARQKGRLRFLDNLAIQVVDAVSGAPYANEEVDVTLADGSTTSATTDGLGKLKLDDVPPGPAKVAMPNPGPPGAEPADPVENGRDVVADLIASPASQQSENGESSANGSSTAQIATGPVPWRLWVARRGTVPTG